MYDYHGRRALITGGAQGFGKQFARRLLQQKCRVCITDIDEAKGQETKQEFMTQFGISEESIHFVKFNVSDKTAWATVWDEAERVMGGKIEVFANNAGINPLHGWEKCLDVMGVAAIRGVFFALDRMSTAKGGQGGRIINTASVAGISHLPLGHITAAGYNMSKHALVTMTRYFGMVDEDIAKNQGVKCYALAPWLADTQLVRSNIEGLVQAGKPITRGGVEIRSVSDYTRAGVPRALTVEEVGEAFVQSMVKDKNGAVYAVFPDTPLIEFPDNQSEVTIAVGVTAMLIASRLGLDVYKPVHFYTIAGIIVFLLIAIIHFFISFIF